MMPPMSKPGAESTLSTFTASDGDNLAVQDWHLPEGVTARGVVLLVHGLGEHAGRYDRVAARLNSWGFAVRGYDQYGHGESGGVRGALPHPSRLLGDLADLIDSSRNRHPGVPLVLLGHSMGGLIAASYVSRTPQVVDGVVLSSPLLATRLTPLQKLLLALVPRVAPNLAVSNGVDVDYLSHDPQVVQAYRRDPLVHDRITGRLARFIGDESVAVRRRAANWKVPTLLMYAGDDRIVDPDGSRAFAAAAPGELVTARCFDGLYHEIFNEQDAEPVYACLKDWLDQRF
ncbi:MAG: acylglycerol lipase-like protein [Ramlibacter sp.]|nr:acylglycerol lipase-like protein [Ramlibacter sp.]MDB5913841.1 acylglycerol lipase-like protein [Ramlibacter sp.]